MWLSGSSSTNSLAGGSYETKNVSSATALPLPHAFPVYAQDSAGRLWIISGQSDASGSTLNDVWFFDTSTNWWTWVLGEPTEVATPVYGTLLQPSPSNVFSSRAQAAGAIDEAAGIIYVYGGHASSNGFATNELWGFHIALQQWAWMGGGQGGSFTPNYPSSQGRGSAGARGAYGIAVSGASCWVDPSGNVWFGAGINYNATMA